MRPLVLLASSIWLGGCVSPKPTENPVEAARAAAATARYRAFIETEKPRPAPQWEILPLRRTRNDGVQREPITELIRIPNQ